MAVVSRVSDEPALEEGNVEDGGIEVDELEDEDLERQVVVELRLGAMHLWKKGMIFIDHVLHMCNTIQ